MYHPEQYTAEDGLNLLYHLDLTLTDEHDIAFFKEEWVCTYHDNEEDFLDTVGDLYAFILPCIWPDTNHADIQTTLHRCRTYRDRIARAAIIEKIEQGKCLDDILLEGPWIFEKIKKLKRS